MNKKLQKQIKAYAGFAGALFAVDKTYGQVIYVDINPDTLTNAAPANSGYHHFLLDVNNDNVFDFDFKAEYQIANSTTSWNASVIRVSPLNNIEIKNNLYQTYPFSSLVPYPGKLNPGDLIDGNGIWLNDSNQCLRGHWSFSAPQPQVLDYEGGCGAWQWGNDKCLGFRLLQNSNYYYGWLRINIVNSISFLLKEYAYQVQPNAPMLACDTTNLAAGVSEYSHQQFIFSQQNNSIHISSLQKLNHANISVYDLLGKEILKQPFESKETTITINKKGIYFVEVQSESGIFRKKIFIY